MSPKTKTAHKPQQAPLKKWGRAEFRKQSIILAKRIVRSREGKCQRCGKVDNLQDSHIYSVGAHPDMAALLENILCLCVGCHLYFWHKEPLEAAKWFVEKYPLRAELLRIRSTFVEKQDWESIYLYYKK